MNAENDNEALALKAAAQLRRLVEQLQIMGRNDLLLQAITVPTLEQLRIEAAKGSLQTLTVTADYRLLLGKERREVALQPVHRAVYLLFLRHPEGIEFKLLSDYREELLDIYRHIAPQMDRTAMEESVARLTNPLDNSLNEKCSRIKAVFFSMMDEYSASYYIIGSQARPIGKFSPRKWYRRLKVITLPRNLVIFEKDADL